MFWAKSRYQFSFHVLMINLILKIYLLVVGTLISHLKVVLGSLNKFGEVWSITYLIHILYFLSIIVLHLNLIFIILDLYFNTFFLFQLFIHYGIVVSKHLQITLLNYIWAIERLRSIPFISLSHIALWNILSSLFWLCRLPSNFSGNSWTIWQNGWMHRSWSFRFAAVSYNTLRVIVSP